MKQFRATLKSESGDIFKVDFSASREPKSDKEWLKVFQASNVLDPADINFPECDGPGIGGSYLHLASIKEKQGGIREQVDSPTGGQQEDEATLWKYLLWALTSTTKDPSSTIKELMKKGLRLSDSSSVDSVAGTDVKAAIIEHMKLWQKLQTSKQKLAVSLKLLAKDKGTV